MNQNIALQINANNATLLPQRVRLEFKLLYSEMEVDFIVKRTKNSPFLDKAVKERTAEEPGRTDIPTSLPGRAVTCLSLQYLLYKTKMARNCEKKLVGLNRLWLAKQQKGLFLHNFKIIIT